MKALSYCSTCRLAHRLHMANRTDIVILHYLMLWYLCHLSFLLTIFMVSGFLNTHLLIPRWYILNYIIFKLLKKILAICCGLILRTSIWTTKQFPFAPVKYVVFRYPDKTLFSFLFLKIFFHCDILSVDISGKILGEKKSAYISIP